MAARRQRSALAAVGRAGCVLALSWLCACEPPVAAPGAGLPRTGRFGTLRDLCLFDRPEAAGGPFFLDRFEATRSDWQEFAASGAALAPALRLERRAAAGDDGALPMAGIDLREARAFARWRHCRLPHSDEWWYATTLGGRNPYPWGQRIDAARANTGELGLGEVVAVGTFESGRQGEGPYDLIGNVGEWTESVPNAWFRSDAERQATVPLLVRHVQRAAGLSVWSIPGVPIAVLWLVEAGGQDVPREVLGADCHSSMDRLVQLRLPHERGSSIGVRLATSPQELLRSLLASPQRPTATEVEQLRRFVTRKGHREALAAAWPAVVGNGESPRGPLLDLLRELLQPVRSGAR